MLFRTLKLVVVGWWIKNWVTTFVSGGHPVNIANMRIGPLRPTYRASAAITRALVRAAATSPRATGNTSN